MRGAHVPLVAVSAILGAVTAAVAAMLPELDLASRLLTLRVALDTARPLSRWWPAALSSTACCAALA